MNTTAKNADITPIPVQLSESEFTAFIFPHLSMPKRGPKCKIGVRRQCGASLGREETRCTHTPWRRHQHRGEKRGDGIGYSGYKHQKGEKVLAMTDNHGYVLSPLPVAPVNKTDMILLPRGLKALKQVAKEVGMDLRGALLNFD